MYIRCCYCCSRYATTMIFWQSNSYYEHELSILNYMKSQQFKFIFARCRTRFSQLSSCDLLSTWYELLLKLTNHIPKVFTNSWIHIHARSTCAIRTVIIMCAWIETVTGVLELLCYDRETDCFRSVASWEGRGSYDYIGDTHRHTYFMKNYANLDKITVKLKWRKWKCVFLHGNRSTERQNAEYEWIRHRCPKQINHRELEFIAFCVCVFFLSSHSMFLFILFEVRTSFTTSNATNSN